MFNAGRNTNLFDMLVCGIVKLKAQTVKVNFKVFERCLF